MTQMPINVEGNNYHPDTLNQRRVKPEANPFLRWWYRASGPAGVPESASFYMREQVRRSRIASLIILGLVCAALLLVPAILLAAPGFFIVPQVISTTLAGIFCCIVALLLNRSKHIYATGILLIIAVDVIVAGVVLSEKSGLDPILLSMYDLLVLTELIAVSLLPSGTVFAVAVLNMVLLVLDVNAQPRSMMWMQMIQSQQLVYSLLARPAILFLIVAAISYLWVNSALNALKRADRAELIAELERRELEQKQELERAIEHILLVQTRVANGDFDARVPIYEHHVLWQVSIAFNNLLARFKSSAQSERNLHRVAEEIAQLRSALKLWQLGQPLRWYPTEKNLLGPLADDLRRTMLPQVAASAAPQGVQAAAQMPHANQGDIRYRSPMTDPGEPAQHIRYRSPVTEPGEPVEQASPPHDSQRPWPRMA